MARTRNFLFNDLKLNTAFLAFLLFIFFLVFCCLSTGYEYFLYSHYNKLYSSRTIYNLTFDIKQIFQRNISDNDKYSYLYGLTEEYLKDKNISEIWMTDRDFRLVYHSDPEVFKSFRYQKMPARYFPLYRDGFKLTGKGFAVNVRNDIDSFAIYAVTPFKLAGNAVLDYTVGLKIKKFSFWFMSNDIRLFKNMNVNFSPFLFIGIILLLSGLFTWIISRFFVVFADDYFININTLNSEILALSEKNDDPAVLQVDPEKNEFLKNLAVSMNSLSKKIISLKEMECIDRVKKGIVDKESRSLNDIVSALFGTEQLDTPGLELVSHYAPLSSRKSHIVLKKQLNSFNVAFLIAEITARGFEQYIFTYLVLNTAIHSMGMESKSHDVMAEISNALIARSLPPISMALVCYNTADAIADICLAGYKQSLFYNYKIRELSMISDPGPMAGKIQENDFKMSIGEERLKLSSHDMLFFFNSGLAGTTLKTENLTTVFDSHGNSSAKDILFIISSPLSSVKEDVFLFMIKKT